MLLWIGGGAPIVEEAWEFGERAAGEGMVVQASPRGVVVDRLAGWGSAVRACWPCWEVASEVVVREAMKRWTVSLSRGAIVLAAWAACWWVCVEVRGCVMRSAWQDSQGRPTGRCSTLEAEWMEWR